MTRIKLMNLTTNRLSVVKKSLVMEPAWLFSLFHISDLISLCFCTIAYIIIIFCTMAYFIIIHYVYRRISSRNIHMKL